MGLSQKDQTKHNTLLRLRTQSVKILSVFWEHFTKCLLKILENLRKIFRQFLGNYKKYYRKYEEVFVNIKEILVKILEHFPEYFLKKFQNNLYRNLQGICCKISENCVNMLHFRKYFLGNFRIIT